MACTLVTSIADSCDKRKLMGGIKKKVWLVSDIVGFETTTTSGYITALTFASYEGLVSMEGVKKSHSFGYEAVKNAVGYISNYMHQLSLKLIAETPDEIGAIEDLQAWEGAAVVEDNNGNFWLLGKDQGLIQATGTKTSGVNPADDFSDILTFTGDFEENMPKRFFVTSYAATLALLESYEI